MRDAGHSLLFVFGSIADTTYMRYIIQLTRYGRAEDTLLSRYILDIHCYRYRKKKRKDTLSLAVDWLYGDEKGVNFAKKFSNFTQGEGAMSSCVKRDPPF